MTKKSRQNFKYLEKENSFLDEIKSIFEGLPFEANKENFFGGRESDFKAYYKMLNIRKR